MSFKKLYDFCQGQNTPVNRNIVRDETLRLTGSTVACRKTALDTTACRGFFLSASNQDSPIVRQHGSNVIVLARGLNRCWERFVYIKELMHLFDDDAHKTGESEVFEQQLSELAFGTAQPAPQTQSEILCFWMALACLCPERSRVYFENERKLGRIDDYTIALQLKIPELYVPRLFEPKFKKSLNMLGCL